MRKFEKFLFLYSIITITIIFFFFGFTSPTPQNFISILLLLPLIFYFWVELTDPIHTPVNVWSPRFILIILLLSALGIFSWNQIKESKEKAAKYLTAATQKDQVKIQELEKEIETLRNEASTSGQIIKELANIKNELLKIKDNSKVGGSSLPLNQSAPDLAAILKGLEDIPLGYIKTKNEKSAWVYQKADSSSEKVGKIESGLTYPFFQKESDWLLMELDSKVKGWVNRREIKEINLDQ